VCDHRIAQPPPPPPPPPPVEMPPIEIDADVPNDVKRAVESAIETQVAAIRSQLEAQYAERFTTHEQKIQQLEANVAK